MEMKPFGRLIVVGLLCWFKQGWAETLTLSVDAIQVEDGDTLKITVADGIKRVQLIGIDAPEDTENPKFVVDGKRTGLSQETLLSLGIIATGHLKKLIAAGDEYELRWDSDKPDKYGRLPGELFTQSGVSIHARMVEEGYAIALPGASSTLQSLQRQAESEHKGLWGLLAKPTRLWAGTDSSN
ncbi:MAG: thermonuclease family protein [Candidatus Thiodiazotropha sp. 'RUGA']|nr:thermonuclease family protein [Candidatus Thiodiazotropha sp. 'RUGA']